MCALLDAGCEVRCVDAADVDHDILAELFDLDEVEWLQADLVDANLDTLVAGCTAVIHCAALVGLSESYDELAPTNVDLVEDLLHAANAAGVEHVVHISAGSVYSAARGLLAEDAAVEPTNDYERTKLDAEAIFHNFDGDTAWTVLRPGHVYGPHCQAMSAGLVTLPAILANFTPILPAFTGGTRSSWVHVEDVAAAAMVVLGNERAYGRTFNVADDTPIGFGEALTAMTEAYGLTIGPLVPFPSPSFLMTFSPVVDRHYTASTLRSVLRQIWKRITVKHALQTPLRPKVDRSVVFYVAEDTVLDNGALTELGWQPKVPAFVDGIGDTIGWYQDHAWVPRFDAQTRTKLRDEDDNVGLAFEQIISGDWTDDGVSDGVHLELEVELPRVVRGDLSGRINGVATFDELVEDAPIEGTINIAIFSSKRLTYEFGFETPNGAHRCEVASDFSPLQPLSSLGRLSGQLTNAQGDIVGKVELRLELAERIVGMLTSFRLL